MTLTTTQKQVGFSLFTVCIYALFFGWKFALIISATILWHEMCHLFMARYLKYPTNGLYLLPFIGGVSFVSGRYKSYADQAKIVFAGPVGGSLLGFLLAGFGLRFHQLYLLQAAYCNLFVNLANLAAPFSFIDAGQLMNTITYSISKKLGVICCVGSTILGTIVILFFNPIIALMVAYFGGRTAWQEIKNWQAYRDGKFHQCTYDYLFPPKALTKKQMAILLVSWASALMVMCSTMYFLHS